MQSVPAFALRAPAVTNAPRTMKAPARFMPAALAETTTVTGAAALTETNAVTGAPPLSSTVALTPSAASKGSLTVGSSSGAMQQFLAQTFILLLREAGYQVADKTNLGDAAAVRAALGSGQIDLAPETLGTALVLFHKLPANTLPATPERLYILAKTLGAQQGLAWLPALTISNTHTLAASPALVAKGVKTITALAAYMKANDAPVKLCTSQEFASGEAGSFLQGLQQQYGFQFKLANVLVMETAKTYEALNRAQCDVAEGPAIDSRLSAWHLLPLTDDRTFFIPDNQAPVIRQSVLTAHPEVATLLSTLQGRLDPQTLTQLHARFMLGADGKPNSGDEETPQAVAYSFLRSRHLLKPPKIAVGAEDYTEQLILGQMMILLLEDAGYPVEDKTGIGGTKALQAAMETGDIDVYAEYASQALTVRHAVPVEAIPTDGEKLWTLAKTLDERKGIIWLAHGPFNDSYTFMVRDDLWNKGVKTMPDLANYLKTKQADLSLCLENDFFSRQYDGLPAVEAAYGFQFQPDKVQLMDLDAVYTSLRKQKCDVGEGYRTDGRGAAWKFHNLADPLAVFGVAQVAPLLRQPVLAANPDLTDVLGNFVQKLDDATMSQLNARVDIGKDGEPSTGDEETPQAVAQDFLTKAGLLHASNPNANAAAPVNAPKATPEKQ
ncbi:MAG: glycine betaine ABC transporter substrate-binding protein [Caldilineaceae bacterium]